MRKGCPLGAPFTVWGDNLAAMDEDRLSGLRAQLDAHHTWPSEYMFKFIAPNQPEKIEAVLAEFPDDVDVKRKSSGGGKYVALTVREVVPSADVIFERYQAVSDVGNILSL